MTTINVFVNDKIYVTSNNLNLIEWLRTIGIELPRFCYHLKLLIAGNCRMCLIEDIKSLKPVIACALETQNNLILYTDTVKVKKARESVLEFSLINHPLDRPICDQGGECDLQDLTLVYGSDRGRFYENKRSIKDKYCGSIVKTVMNRCIHCTRCVRFSSYFTSNYHRLNLLGRGNTIEVSTYLEIILTNPFLGTIIDLCPVGALTPKLQSFKYRSWELESLLTANIYDEQLEDILIDRRNNHIIRVRPSTDYKSWMSNSIRYSYDVNRYERCLNPIIIEKKTRKNFIDWNKFFSILYNIYVNLSSLSSWSKTIWFYKWINMLEFDVINQNVLRNMNAICGMPLVRVKKQLTYPHSLNNKLTVCKSLLLYWWIQEDYTWLNLKANKDVIETLNVIDMHWRWSAFREHSLNIGNNWLNLINIINNKHLICLILKKTKQIHLFITSNSHVLKTLSNSLSYGNKLIYEFVSPTETRNWNICNNISTGHLDIGVVFGSNPETIWCNYNLIYKQRFMNIPMTINIYNDIGIYSNYLGIYKTHTKLPVYMALSHLKTSCYKNDNSDISFIAPVSFHNEQYQILLSDKCIKIKMNYTLTQRPFKSRSSFSILKMLFNLWTNNDYYKLISVHVNEGIIKSLAKSFFSIKTTFTDLYIWQQNFNYFENTSLLLLNKVYPISYNLQYIDQDQLHYNQKTYYLL